MLIVHSVAEKSWSERKGGKIDLQTDEYGNIMQPQAMYVHIKIKCFKTLLMVNLMI